MLTYQFLALLLAFGVESKYLEGLKELKTDDTHPCKAENLKLAESYYCDNNGKWYCQNGWKSPENTTEGYEFDHQNPCAIPVCSNGCGHGRCVHPEVCACDVGWDGFTCGNCVPLGGCLHGGCREALECNCALAKDKSMRNKYEGAHCDIPKCTPKCVHGHCTAPNECTCENGWTGPDCNTCQALPGCLHGSCCKNSAEGCESTPGLGVPNSCFCKEGWTGHLCDQPICAEGCNMTNAHCNKPGECICDTQWSGETCNQCEAHWSCHNKNKLTNCNVPNECICIGIDETYCTSVINSTYCSTCNQANTEFCEKDKCHCKRGWRGEKCNLIDDGKVLIATGRPFENGRKTEIVDLSDPDFQCSGLPEYPENKYGGGAMILDDMVLVCGGWDGSAIGDCYKLGPNKEWTVVDTQLQTTRIHAGYGNVVVNESLWKSGGMDADATAELVNSEFSVATEDLPEAMYSHCSIQIDDENILVTGGRTNEGPTTNTYFHNFKTGEWKDGPKLQFSRHQHGCDAFYVNGQMVLVVAGGHGPEAPGGDGNLKSVEFLKMKDNTNVGEWFSTEATDLPESLCNFPLVTSINGKKIFAIGGSKATDNHIVTTTILELTCGDTVESCRWDRNPTTLDYGRRNHVALPIPNSMVEKLC